jgi:hypothetical protein
MTNELILGFSGPYIHYFWVMLASSQFGILLICAQQNNFGWREGDGMRRE